MSKPEETATKEYRRKDRIPVSGFIQVVNTMTGQPVGRISNLSTDGMMLITHHDVLDDTLFQVTFSLPRSSEELQTGIHALWCDRANAPGTWWVGVRIIDISADDQQALDEWLRGRGKATAASGPN